MTPREYLIAVNRWLDLPPWFRLLELNQLAKTFCAERRDGISPEETEASLGSPLEAARSILARYPRYRKSSLRFFPLVFSFLGLWQLVCSLIILKTGFRAPLPESLAAASPGLTPAAYLTRCAAVMVAGFYFYLTLKYYHKK